MTFVIMYISALLLMNINHFILVIFRGFKKEVGLGIVEALFL